MCSFSAVSVVGGVSASLVSHCFYIKYPRDTSTDTRTFHLQGAPFIFMPLINHHIVELTMEPQALEFRLHRT